jgi:hypothetical protein
MIARIKMERSGCGRDRIAGVEKPRSLAQHISHLLQGAKQRLAAGQLTGRLSKARHGFHRVLR